jgi:DNA recombination protein RmuC
MKDVKIHIDAIASKYIRADEGTFDFALMYIPAENVYYETIIKDEELGGEMALFNYALSKRVIPVSPNSFYAYLQTILLGLKGLRVEESAREMLNQLASLGKEFERFEDSFRLVGQHLANSQSKYQEAEKRFGKIQGRFEQIDGTIKELSGPAAPSTPALQEK